MVIACLHMVRACLDQFTSDRDQIIDQICDHSWSKTRLIANVNLIAKLVIIYCYSAQPHCAEYQLSLPLLALLHPADWLLYTNRAWGGRE